MSSRRRTGSFWQLQRTAAPVDNHTQGTARHLKRACLAGTQPGIRTAERLHAEAGCLPAGQRQDLQAAELDIRPGFGAIGIGQFRAQDLISIAGRGDHGDDRSQAGKGT